VHVMGAEAFTVTVLEVTVAVMHNVHPSWGCFSLFLSYLWFGLRYQTCGPGAPLSLAVRTVWGCRH
jgi:hypothetical protein